MVVNPLQPRRGQSNPNEPPTPEEYERAKRWAEHTKLLAVGITRTQITRLEFQRWLHERAAAERGR